MEPEFISVKQASEVLNISKPTFYHLLNKNRITSALMGRRRLVDVQSIRNLANQIRTDGFLKINNDDQLLLQSAKHIAPEVA